MAWYGGYSFGQVIFLYEIAKVDKVMLFVISLSMISRKIGF